MEGPLVLFLGSKVAANTAFFLVELRWRWLCLRCKCAAESGVTCNFCSVFVYRSLRCSPCSGSSANSNYAALYCACSSRLLIQLAAP